MRTTVSVRRIALCFVPAALAALGLLIAGCDGAQEGPVSPSLVERDATDKERNAVDLGPGAVSAQSGMSSSSVSAYGSAASIPFAPEPGPFANPGPVCDDCVFGGLPIGFGFTFFGNTYTTFNLSSNGLIGFGPTTGSGCCSGQPIPSADGINNLIAAAWTDLYPGGGGAVSYETRGRAPSRYLVVNYQDIPWCCETGTSRVTTQIILYEGTNTVEIHTANQSVGHIYTQGVEDASGTQAAFIPGRVAANYGYVNDAVRFTTETAWATRAPLPSARRLHAVAVANSVLYAIGGLNSAGTGQRGVFAYNPSTNSWSTKASLPAVRQGGNGAAAIGSTVYVAGGYDAAKALTRTLYAYNTSSNTWSTRANMPAVGACGGSAVISGKLYVFSGCTRSSTGSEIESGLLHRYDPSTNLWTTLRSAPREHYQPAVGVISGKLYVAGGNTVGVTTGRLDVYNPATNTWSTKAAMPTARVGVAGTVVGGKLHVMGGRNAGTYLNTVEAYNPVTNSWSVRAAMPTARAVFGGGVISNLVYAVGGNNSTGVLTTNERFTP